MRSVESIDSYRDSSGYFFEPGQVFHGGGDEKYPGALGFDLSLTSDTDIDRDGLLNNWEDRGAVTGTDVRTPNPIDNFKLATVELRGDRTRRDLYVETDWTARRAGRNRTAGRLVPGDARFPADDPNQNNMGQVADAFANAPAQAWMAGNDELVSGISLWADFGSNSVHPVTTNLGGGNELPDYGKICVNNDAYRRAKKDNFDPNRRWVYHYSIWGVFEDRSSSSIPESVDDCDDAGGRAEITGNDFVIFKDSASNYMHELGHNLSLRHGGGEDIPNYKPNYLSIMNYSYSDGINQNLGRGQVLDYSPVRPFDLPRSRLSPKIDELSLNETAAINSSVNLRAVFYKSGKILTARTDQTFVDWNDDKIAASGYSQVVRAPKVWEIIALAVKCVAAPYCALNDHNDWEAVDLRFVNDADSQYLRESDSEVDPVSLSIERGEPTEEEAHQRTLQGFLGDFAATASVKPDLNGSRRFGVTVEQVDDNNSVNAMWTISIDSGNLVFPSESCEWIDAQNARCFSATRIPLEEIEFGVDANGPVVVKVNVPTVRDINGITTTIDPNPANNTTTITLPAFQFDTIPPILSSSIDPASNVAGWNRGPVNVSWQSEDPAPSSGTPSQPAPTVIASEGPSQIVNARSCDPAGNCAVGTAMVSIDSSPPLITVAGNAGSYLPTQTVTVSCSTTDALSGVATQNCPTISSVAASFGPGPHSFTATAQDKAGNVASQQFSFTVAETGALASPTSCSVEFVSAKNNGDTFAAKIQVTNNGPALPRWHLTWTYRAGESVTGVTLNATTAQGTNALLFTNGPGVDLYGSGANATFRAGNRLQTPIWIKGTWNASSKKATPPNQFALNGKPCTVDVHGSSYDK